MSYRADLDGIRCVAVLLVLIFHFDLGLVGHAGFIGVDLFFVLSGFLISGLIWQELERGAFSLKTFYLRRLRRLGPALLVVQAAALAVGAIFLLPSAVLTLAEQTLFTQLYVVNFYFWKSVNYFGLHGPQQPFLHCWSLAVEEQFYFFFPLFLLLVRRFARAHKTAVLLVCALGSFALNLAVIGAKPEAVFYLLPTRAWELLAGALVHSLERSMTRSSTRNVAGVLGGALIAASLALYNPAVPFPGWIALLPVAGTMGLILAGTASGSVVSRVLSWRGAVYVGKISYSLYLVHWPIRVYTDELVQDYSLGWRVGAFLASFAIADALHRFVEQPLRQQRWLPPRRFLVAYGASASSLIAVVTWAVLSGGWPGRFSQQVLELTAGSKDVNETYRDCAHAHGEPTKPWCLLGRRDVRPTFTVVGDSHAIALAHAFSLAFEHRGIGAQLMAGHGCMPVLDFGIARCRRLVETTIGDLTAADQPENVVLVSVWRPGFDAGVSGPGGGWLVGDEAEKAFQKQFEKTVQVLRDAGKTTYVWMGLPISPNDVPMALARKAAFGTELPLTQPYSSYQRDFAFLEQAVAHNSERLGGTISAAKAMCDGGVCRFVKDGRPLFSDNNHPAFSSSEFFASLIERELEAVVPTARQ